MYAQTYTFGLLDKNGGIPEKCAYEEPKECTEEVTDKEFKNIFNFLKPLDSYGFKKL